MRFPLLLVGSLVTGTWAVGASHGVFPGSNQVFQALTSLGGHSVNGGIVDINPFRTFNNVMQRVTSPTSPADLGFKAEPVVIKPDSFRAMNGLTNSFNADGMGKNGFAASLQSQIEDNNRRMQDMSNFARNPAGWHGMPPH